MACALTLISATATAEAPASLEYQVKASYLYNFLQFIDWPSGAHGGADEPLVIRILGPDRFGTALEVLAGKTVGGRPIVTRLFYATAITRDERRIVPRPCEAVVHRLA